MSLIIAAVKGPVNSAGEILFRAFSPSSIKFLLLPIKKKYLIPILKIGKIEKDTLRRRSP